MADALDLPLKPSALAHRWLFWLHALPLVTLPLAMAQDLMLVLIAGAIALSWLRLRRHPAFGYGPRALVRLQALPDGGWRLYTAAGRSFDARLQDDTYRQPWLLVLNFRDVRDGRRWSRALLGDETTEEGLRRLRQRLSLPPREPSEPSEPPPA